MHKTRYSKFFPVLFFLADIFCLNGAFLLANQYRFKQYFPEYDYLTLQGIINLIWLVIFFATRLNRIDRDERLIDHINKVLTGLVINLSIVFALWFITNPSSYSRQHLFYTYASFTVFIIGWRALWHYAIRYYRLKGFNIRNVAIIGYDDLPIELETYFRTNKAAGYKFLGYFDDDAGRARGRYLGSIESIIQYVENHSLDIIFCYLPRLYDKQLKFLMDFAENNLIKVKIISQFSRLGNRNLTIQKYGYLPIINVSAIPLDRRINQIIKRVFDLIFSILVVLCLFSWLLPIIAFLIKMESKGPVFFKQNRTGRDNRPFLCYKFRTMVVNYESDSKQAVKNDPRITKVGAILRKTSIDELPQFFNVLFGDMSVVGPRPHPLKLNEEFQPQIDRFIQRHAVKPGITGLAQAKGFRGETAHLSDMSGRVRLDRFYVKNWSLLLDIKIIILTAISIIRGNENAY